MMLECEMLGLGPRHTGHSLLKLINASLRLVENWGCFSRTFYRGSLVFLGQLISESACGGAFCTNSG